MGHGERFSGFVRDGKVRIDDKLRLKALMARMEGKPVELSIGRLRQNRSIKANAYLWSIYRLIGQETGNDEYRIHAVMKGMFLPLEDLELPNGTTVKTLGSTRGLDTKAFGEFIDKVKAFAGEQGIRVPEPEEVGAL